MSRPRISEQSKRVVYIRKQQRIALNETWQLLELFLKVLPMLELRQA